MSEIEPLADSIAVTASRLGVCRSIIYQEIKAGRLRAVKFRTRTLITREDQLAWLNSLPSMNSATAA